MISEGPNRQIPVLAQGPVVVHLRPVHNTPRLPHDLQQGRAGRDESDPDRGGRGGGHRLVGGTPDTAPGQLNRGHVPVESRIHS